MSVCSFIRRSISRLSKIAILPSQFNSASVRCQGKKNKGTSGLHDYIVTQRACILSIVIIVYAAVGAIETWMRQLINCLPEKFTTSPLSALLFICMSSVSKDRSFIWTIIYKILIILIQVIPDAARICDLCRYSLCVMRLSKGDLYKQYIRLFVRQMGCNWPLIIRTVF